jgi:hypothetical protein
LETAAATPPVCPTHHPLPFPKTSLFPLAPARPRSPARRRNRRLPSPPPPPLSSPLPPLPGHGTVRSALAPFPSSRAALRGPVRPSTLAAMARRPSLAVPAPRRPVPAPAQRPRPASPPLARPRLPSPRRPGLGARPELGHGGHGAWPWSAQPPPHGAACSPPPGPDAPSSSGSLAPAACTRGLPAAARRGSLPGAALAPARPRRGPGGARPAPAPGVASAVRAVPPASSPHPWLAAVALGPASSARPPLRSAAPARRGFGSRGRGACVARPRRVRDPFATRQRGLARACSRGARCFGVARCAIGATRSALPRSRRARLPP